MLQDSCHRDSVTPTVLGAGVLCLGVIGNNRILYRYVTQGTLSEHWWGDTTGFLVVSLAGVAMISVGVLNFIHNRRRSRMSDCNRLRQTS